MTENSLNKSRVSKLSWSILLLLIAFAVISFTRLDLARASDGLLHVWILDIGQGDSILIQAPNGKQLLVDGGPDSSITERLLEVMPMGDRTLDVILSTHTDADHLKGFLSVLDNYKVENITETGMVCDTATCHNWEKSKKIEDANVYILRAGEEIDLGDEVKLSIIHPFESVEGIKLAKTNNGGVVARLTYGKFSMLLTADVEVAVENNLLNRHSPISADFLKVGHHGSKTSTTEAFLKTVNPIAAFISVGAKNTYGHPTTEVLSRLQSYAIKYYRTDKNGTIELVSDGESYKIQLVK